MAKREKIVGDYLTDPSGFYQIYAVQMRGSKEGKLFAFDPGLMGYTHVRTCIDHKTAISALEAICNGVMNINEVPRWFN
jgi:hypothetical protein